jgi:hypothetical protein
MWAAWRDEWRGVVRMPAFWLMLVAGAALAYALLPVNAGISEFMNLHDRQTDREIVDTFRSDGLNLYTSGFGCGQLLSFLLGAGLVLRDYHPARLRTPGRPAADPTRAMPAKLLTAIVAGGVFAVVDLAVTLSAAGPSARHLWDTWGLGHVVDRDLLHDPAVLAAVILGVVGFPLWAALGVGLGALAGNWPTLVRTLGAGSVISTCVFYGTARLASPVWAALGTALTPPSALPPSTILSIATSVNSPYRWPVAVSGTLGAALYTVAFYYTGRTALHRRFTRERAGSVPV